MNALRSTDAGPLDCRCWRTRITSSNTTQTARATVNAASAAPGRKTRGTTTWPVHHPGPRAATLTGPETGTATSGPSFPGGWRSSLALAPEMAGVGGVRTQ